MIHRAFDSRNAQHCYNSIDTLAVYEWGENKNIRLCF